MVNDRRTMRLVESKQTKGFMSCLKKLCGGGRTVLIFLFLFVASNNSSDNLKQNISTLRKPW